MDILNAKTPIPKSSGTISLPGAFLSQLSGFLLGKFAQQAPRVRGLVFSLYFGHDQTVLRDDAINIGRGAESRYPITQLGARLLLDTANAITEMLTP